MTEEAQTQAMAKTASDQDKSIANLEPKTRLQGKVEETRLHGAVIDVGLEYKGLLHISQLAADNNISRVDDVIKSGDEVTVWVTNVNPEQHRISLTMIEPPDVTWSELTEGQLCTGTVTRIESYGAFINIGAERPGLLHVREMSTEYVEHPSELVSVGAEIDVRILKVDRRRRRIDLTMMGLEPETVEEPEETVDEDEEEKAEEETSQTSMELALQRAYADQDEKPEEARTKEQQDFSERQEIMTRTIEQHSKESKE